MTKRQAVSYLRVSGKGQIAGHGLPRQREVVRTYAKSHGLDLVGEYRDEGVSGTKGIADRPGLGELLERVAGNGVRVVLVERADRLARDLIESELIVRELRGLGVTVIAGEGGVNLSEGDDSDPTSKLIRQVLGAVSEFEKNSVVLKLRVSRIRARKRDGRCEGAKPFGFYEGEEGTLRRARQLRRRNGHSGKQRSYGAVAAVLNEERLSSRSGRPWTRGTVHNILTA